MSKKTIGCANVLGLQCCRLGARYGNGPWRVKPFDLSSPASQLSTEVGGVEESPESLSSASDAVGVAWLLVAVLAAVLATRLTAALGSALGAGVSTPTILRSVKLLARETTAEWSRVGGAVLRGGTSWIIARCVKCLTSGQVR
jgi:hypothetical protein